MSDIITSNGTHTKNRFDEIFKTLQSSDVQAYFDDTLENELVLNMGPQHPATHGVLRIVVALDGETVVKAVPDLGYLHRGYEKLAENMTFHEFIPHTDRLDYLSPLANNVAYVLAVEKLLGVEITPRTKYIRTICCEFARIASHLVSFGTFAMDVGAMTVFLWSFREREKILDILDLFAGVRFTTSYTRIGSVWQDLSDEVLARMKVFLDEFPANLKECQALLERNRIFINRCEGIGYMSKEDLISMGITGPLLRASGIERDLRREAPYLAYPELDFNIPIFTESDVLARYYVRIAELYESVKILKQCLQKIPKGPIDANNAKQVIPQKEVVYTKMEELIDDFMIVNFGNIPTKGAEAYQAIESSKGELGFYIISDGKGYPFRLKIRSPSFANLQALGPMCKGCMISDIVAIIGSIDPVMGEADK